MLSVVAEELLDMPFYYTIGHLGSALRSTAIPLVNFRSAIIHAGYKVGTLSTMVAAGVVWSSCFYLFKPNYQ